MSDLTELRQLIESNAKAIQASATERSEMRTAIATLTEGQSEMQRAMATLAQSLGTTMDQHARLVEVTTESFQAIREDRAETDQQIQVLIEEGRHARQQHEAWVTRFDQKLEDDRQNFERQFEENQQQHTEFVERFDRQFEENQRQHTEFVERFDRQFEENKRQHNAFVESFQSLLLEIQAIWRRLNGGTAA
ncbi:MAG: DUF459 domain-containing protein [Cyanothece sp. SIO1E1]|nr:DUF459 domain-containing protein [Cyanothece sp. SIO1E1]